MSKTPDKGGEWVREPSAAEQLPLLALRGMTLREPTRNHLIEQESALEQLPPPLLQSIIDGDTYERWVELQHLRRVCLTLAQSLPETRDMDRLVYETGFALATVNAPERLDSGALELHLAPFLRVQLDSPVIIVSGDLTHELAGGLVSRTPHLYGSCLSSHQSARVELGVGFTLTPHNTTDRISHRISFSDINEDKCLLVVGRKEIKELVESELFDRDAVVSTSTGRLELENQTHTPINTSLLVAVRAAGFSLETLGIARGEIENIATLLALRIDQGIKAQFFGEGSRTALEALFAVDPRRAASLASRAKRARLL